MAKSIKAETKMAHGFKFFQADAEVYRAVRGRTAEKFGKDSRAHQTIMSGINTSGGLGSQFFFNTQVGLYLPERQRVASLKDWNAIWSQDPSFLAGNYADLPMLILRSGQPTYGANTPIIQDLTQQARDRNLTFSPENPLVIHNASIVDDNNSRNHYGILVKLSENPEDTLNDPRFSYKANSIKVGTDSKGLQTKTEGLSRVRFNGNVSVDVFGHNLEYSNVVGQVVVFEDIGKVPKTSAAL